MTGGGAVSVGGGEPPPGDGAPESLPLGGALPELATVHWRSRVDRRSLGRADRRWTRNTLAGVTPFVATAVALPWLSPILIPVSVVALAHAWLIPELTAARGAGVLRAPRRRPGVDVPDVVAESRALGLLGDLVDHDARELLRRCGLALEVGSLGAWLVGPAGALLVRPGGRRVRCYCVRAAADDLPRADRIAHLLLALRADERGFATVANLTFSGAPWRLRRRLKPDGRTGLDAAVAVARADDRWGGVDDRWGGVEVR